MQEPQSKNQIKVNGLHLYFSFFHLDFISLKICNSVMKSVKICVFKAIVTVILTSLFTKNK